MIIVTGIVMARPDAVDEALRVATGHVLRSRTEAGCISHEVLRDPADPCRLVFVERWTDMAALKAHFAVPASGDSVRALATLSSTPPKMLLYDATEIAQR